MYRDLRPFPLDAVFTDAILNGEIIVTMSIGQWDGLLSAAYAAGCILLELDDNELPIRAYQRADAEELRRIRGGTDD